MATLDHRTGTWRFGVYEVDTRKLQLRRSGVSIKLREQPFRILMQLLENAGQIVTREELRRLLWPADTYVDFDHSLNTAVMNLRNVLGDPAGAPMYIQTIPRRGYRFIAPVVFVPDDTAPASPPATSAEPTASGGFSLAVLPLKCTGTTSETTSFADGLTDEIVAGLSRFSYLRLVRKDHSARYVLDGALRQAGSKLRATIRLTDSASNETLWTETYEQPFEPDSLFDLQDYLVPRVVSTIADCRGILPRSVSATLCSEGIEEMAPEEAVLRTCAYFERVNAEEHAATRTVLERALELAPEDCLGWAMLSLIHKDELANGFNRQPDSLDRALAAAQRAVETGPNDHLSHLSLACARFFGKDFPAFRSAADRALELNPIDGFSIATLGSLIAYSGEWGLGCALAERAHDLNPYQPGRYWFGHLFNAYRKGEYATAVEIALRINMPRFWQSNLVLAAACGQLGDGDGARRSLQALDTAWPGFCQSAPEELSRWWDAALVDRLLEGLRKAERDGNASAANDSLPERPTDEFLQDLAASEPEVALDSPAPITSVITEPESIGETRETTAAEPKALPRPYLTITLSLLFAIAVLIVFVLARRFT